jgi:hypothetical protein
VPTEPHVVVTEEPWALDIDTLIVSAGGELAGQLTRRFPEAGWRRTGIVPVQSGGTLRLVVVAALLDSVEATVDEALVEAEIAGAARVGLPILGSGAAGYPPEEAAAAVVGAVRASPTPLDVVLVCRDEAMRAAVLAAWPPPAVQLTPAAESALALAVARSGGAVPDDAVVLAAALSLSRARGRTDVAGTVLSLARVGLVDDLREEVRLLGAVDPGPAVLPAADRARLEPLLQRAGVIARSTTGRGIVHSRHLLAAVAGAAPPTVSFGQPFADLLREAVRRMVPGEAPAAWDEVLGIGELAGGVSADLVSERGIPLGEDRLGVRNYVTMLATVMVREDTPLPLSIGLFGEWGAGKSYFMGLLRGEVDRLAGRPPYCRDVQQITFNAWHYADTNLWASLGNHIFGTLAGAPGDDRWTEVRAELDKTVKRRQELTVATATAEARVAELRERVDAHRRDSRVSLRALAGSPVVRDRLGRVWARLGVTDQVEQGELLAGELGGVRADLSVWRQVTAGRRGVALTALVVLTLLLAAGALADPRWLAGSLTTLAALLTVATNGVRQVRAGLRELTALATDLEEEQVAGPLADLRRAEADAAVAQAQLDEVVTRVGELGRELAELSPGQRLYSFISERAASADYRSRLGLVSTVRHDLKQLADLMEKWRTNRGASPTPIDRIVLYIDDLDRCSPEQVVDVLQAVHLLLALDLFVVVVGVDPRWLLHSLETSYPGTLQADGGPGGQASPVDYLEKIFNIPFTLPRLTPTAFGGLLRSLAGGPAPVLPTPLIPTTEPFPDLEPVGIELPVEPRSEVAVVLRGETPAPRAITEPELVLLEALAPLVRSPRSAKRLVNLYRMLRSTRDVSPTSRFLGTDGRPGEHEAVAVLLGILTAYPRLLGELLHAPAGLCGATTHRSWPDFVRGLAPRQDGGRWLNDVCPELDERARADWADLVDALGPATALVTHDDLAAFRACAPRVTRFSFVLSPLAH